VGMAERALCRSLEHPGRLCPPYALCRREPQHRMLLRGGTDANLS
jgi:hypothetical protein